MSLHDLYETLWPIVHSQLPATPCTVVEIGCGPNGGFVRKLTEAGHTAIGVDPVAPAGSSYIRAAFEAAQLREPAELIIAVASLHHVADVREVLDRTIETLTAEGRLLVIEWGWERLDDATATWCFERLPTAACTDESNWLRTHHERWLESKLPWTTYLQRWATEHRLHRADEMLEQLDERFTRLRCEPVPYYFVDLDRTSAIDELAALDAGTISPSAFVYVGTAAAPTSGRMP